MIFWMISFELGCLRREYLYKLNKIFKENELFFFGPPVQLNVVRTRNYIPYQLEKYC